MSSPNPIQELLCEQWCADLDVAEVNGGLRINLPLYEDDGDAVTVWIEPQAGGWELRDHGSTMMRLSYGMDVDTLQQGTRAKVLQQIIASNDLRMENGEIRQIVQERHLGDALLQFGQAVLRIADVKLWTRNRVASTFYEDLADELHHILGERAIEVDYVPPGIARDYPVDFAVLGNGEPLYIFGVPSSDKARLATIVLQHLRQREQRFRPLVVPSDLSQIVQSDLRRLLNVGGEMVDSLQSRDALADKVRQLAPPL